MSCASASQPSGKQKLRLNTRPVADLPQRAKLGDAKPCGDGTSSSSAVARPGFAPAATFQSTESTMSSWSGGCWGTAGRNADGTASPLSPRTGPSACRERSIEGPTRTDSCHGTISRRILRSGRSVLVARSEQESRRPVSVKAGPDGCESIPRTVPWRPRLWSSPPARCRRHAGRRLRNSFRLVSGNSTRRPTAIRGNLRPVPFSSSAPVRREARSPTSCGYRAGGCC